MKKLKYVSFVLFLAISVPLILCSCTYFGLPEYYYDSPQEARRHSDFKDLYRKDTKLYSAEYNEGIVDFAINGNDISIIFIRRADNKGDTVYKTTFSLTHFWDQEVEKYEKDNNYHFVFYTTPDRDIGIEWCIVEKSFNKSHKGYEAFEIERDGKIYHLCLRYSPTKFPLPSL